MIQPHTTDKVRGADIMLLPDGREPVQIVVATEDFKEDTELEGSILITEGDYLVVDDGDVVVTFEETESVKASNFAEGYYQGKYSGANGDKP